MHFCGEAWSLELGLTEVQVHTQTISLLHPIQSNGAEQIFSHPQ